VRYCHVVESESDAACFGRMRYKSYLEDVNCQLMRIGYYMAGEIRM
jgi:hypothetical protein